MQEFEDLGGGVGDAQGKHGLGVVLEFLEFAVEGFGDGSAAHFGEAFDLGDVGDGHDAWDDGDAYAFGASSVDEVEVFVVVEEELCDEELASGIDFSAEVVEVEIEVFGFDVALGVAGATDAEVEVFVGVGDEFVAVLETVFVGYEFGFASWRVTAEGKDIFDAGVLESGEDAVDFVARGADACKVGHGFDAVVVAEVGDEVERTAAGGSACAIGNGDERGFERLELYERVTELLESGGGFWWEEFEGDTGLSGCNEFAYSHVSLVFAIGNQWGSEVGGIERIARARAWPHPRRIRLRGRTFVCNVCAGDVKWMGFAGVAMSVYDSGFR